MHPLTDDLFKYANKLLDDNRQTEIKSHLNICQLCQEIVEDFQIQAKLLEKQQNYKIPDEIYHLRDSLFNGAQPTNIITLKKLPSEIKSNTNLLAADGKDDSYPSIQNLVTLYSESPEVILRFIRDNIKNEDYLQLISENTEYSSHVMVQVPDLDYEFITDQNGKATVKNIDTEKLLDHKWQIKLPDAIFDLQPVDYNPEKTEYVKDIILETEKHDKIKVTFEGKTEGKNIKIEIVSLDGISDHRNIKVAVIQNSDITTGDINKNKQTSFKLGDSNEISIRLFNIS